MARISDLTDLPTRCKYPWDTWFDGQIWELEPGVDFDMTVKSFQTTVSITARRHGKTAKTRKTKSGTLLIQARATEVAGS